LNTKDYLDVAVYHGLALVTGCRRSRTIEVAAPARLACPMSAPQYA